MSGSPVGLRNEGSRRMSSVEGPIDTSGLREGLISRLSGLRDIFRTGLISREILSHQLMELAGSVEARKLWNAEMKPDAVARRLLVRLEDPSRWRKESAEPEEERLSILHGRLADILLTPDSIDGSILELLLDTADLPHFASFLDTGDPGTPTERAGVELSVLD